MNTDQITELILTFLDDKEITYHLGSICGPCTLPGLKIDQGIIYIDKAQITHPGDIIYKAGYVAVAAPSERTSLSDEGAPLPATEMAAMAWSYAAAIDLNLDPNLIFHPDAYQEGGAHLTAQYSEQATGLNSGAPGVPMLQWFRMTTTFPIMQQWLRTIEDPTQDN